VDELCAATDRLSILCQCHARNVPTLIIVIIIIFVYFRLTYATKQKILP